MVVGCRFTVVVDGRSGLRKVVSMRGWRATGDDD